MSPHRILVIDDDPYLPRIIELSLAPLGQCVCRFASSGRQGIQMAETDPPDLILLDFNLPGMDGLETLQRLRASQRVTRTPIIAITGSLLARTAPRCAAMIAGCQAYLPKPFDFDLLRQTVRRFLKPLPEPAPSAVC
jgi:CheY-like chemotaxis protein